MSETQKEGKVTHYWRCLRGREGDGCEDSGKQKKLESLLRHEVLTIQDRVYGELMGGEGLRAAP